MSEFDFKCLKVSRDGDEIDITNALSDSSLDSEGYEYYLMMIAANYIRGLRSEIYELERTKAE